MSELSQIKDGCETSLPCDDSEEILIASLITEDGVLPKLPTHYSLGRNVISVSGYARDLAFSAPKLFTRNVRSSLSGIKAVDRLEEERKQGIRFSTNDGLRLKLESSGYIAIRKDTFEIKVEARLEQKSSERHEYVLQRLQDGKIFQLFESKKDPTHFRITPIDILPSKSNPECTYKEGRLIRKVYLCDKGVYRHQILYQEDGKVRAMRLWQPGDSGWEPLRGHSFDHSIGVGRVFDSRTGIVNLYGINDQKLCDFHFSDRSYPPVMYTKAGKAFGSFEIELQKNLELTPEEYLHFLAQELDTPLKLEIFVKHFLRYVPEDSKSDKWQTSEETMKRAEDGVMLGDCEDFAFFARDILQLQGYNAHVVVLRRREDRIGHGFCLWLTERGDGYLDAHTLGTYGFDRNGRHQLSHKDSSEGGTFSCPIEAIESVFQKYSKPGVGVEKKLLVKITEEEPIRLINFTPEGKQQWYQAEADFFSPRNTPTIDYKSLREIQGKRKKDGSFQ